MTDKNTDGTTPEITNDMRNTVQNWVDQGVETYGSGWDRIFRELGKSATTGSVSETTEPTEPTPKIYPSEQRRRDRALRAELLLMANEYPEGRVAYLCLPENREQSLRLGLIRPEDIE